MTYKFGETSERRLSECHPKLRELMRRVILHRDCSITEGHRGEKLQNQYFEEGKSKLQWPDSKHNSDPSWAVDVVPWPEKWSSEKAFLKLNKIILEEWSKMDTEGYELRWGGDWDSDGDREDQKFDDMPHYELVAV